VRLVLGEKRLLYREVVERYWERPEALTALNPSGLIPVLVETDGDNRLVACESRAIIDHLDERHPDPPLLPASPASRAEVRRLIQWFDRKFDYEVNGLLLHEKMEKRLLGLGAPDPAALRQGREAMRAHFGYLDGLLQERTWLAGERMSLADLVASAHLSVIDYVGEAAWKHYPALKSWYAKIKSRPSFRTLLTDRAPGMPPPDHYHDLDF
jgi:glutathione S-transferase